MEVHFFWCMIFVFYELFSGGGASKVETPKERKCAQHDSVLQFGDKGEVQMFMLRCKGEEVPRMIGWINPTEDGKGMHKRVLTSGQLSVLSFSQRVLVLRCGFFKDHNNE